MHFKLIVAMCNNRGIGDKNKLPWSFSCDMKYFSRITRGNDKNAIIMGRKTFESIGRVLPNRHNIILSTTKSPKTEDNIVFFDNISSIISFCKEKDFHDVWVIGGESIYKQFLESNNLIKEIYITKINKDYNCDSFFPELDEKYKLISNSATKESDTILNFMVYSLL